MDGACKKTNDLKITIITVCKNAFQCIQQTVESVINQTYPNIEYLVIDGQSSDGTLDVLHLYDVCEIMTVFSEKDFGIYNAMNRGIARASGDYIYFLNAGDTLYSDKVIEEAAAYIEINSDAIYCGGVKMIDPLRPDESRLFDYADIEERLEEWIKKGNMPCHQGIFAPKMLLRNHYFMEKFRLCADFEWLLYSVRHNAACRCLPLVIANYDTVGESSSMKNSRQLMEEMRSILRGADNGKQGHTIAGVQTNNEWMQQYDENYQNLSAKHLRMFLLMDKWVMIKQKEKTILKYFYDRGIRNIAIYGMGYIGKRLIAELKDTDISIRFLIDQKYKNICSQLPVYHPNQSLPRADAIIVTVVDDFDEISKLLKQHNVAEILSFEDIIEYCL